MASPGGFRYPWSLIAGGAHRVALAGLLQRLLPERLLEFIGRFVPQSTPQERTALIHFAGRMQQAGRIQQSLPPAGRIRLADIPVNQALVAPPGTGARYRYRLLTEFENPNTGRTEVRSMVVWSGRILANRELVDVAHREGRERRSWADSLPSALRSDDIQFTSVSVQAIERTR